MTFSLTFHHSSFSLQFELEVTVAPKGATLKVDGEAVTLTDEGKYVKEFEFDKEVALTSELEGHVTHDKPVKIEAKDNKVAIDLPKAKV